MNLKLAISAALSFAGLVTSTVVPCAEAERFGTFIVSPTTVNPGDNITISVDLNCGIGRFGIVPNFLDFSIVVPVESNNGHEPPIVLARRDFDSSTGSTSDQFTTKVPFAFYFAGAPYQILLTNTYPINGTDGSEVLQQGGVYGGITINI
ncbi:hypothetical protein C0993_007836 [Termitomyces sp. T159_Od127]|nr:hypothetical protein C0993_007836 [Termitomyces sp. T159_Od127]